MKDENFAVPAKVRYKGDNSNKFTNNKVYDAYFIEYWQGIRNSLHVKDDTGRITDFNPLEDFEIISDPADVLNFHEAIVECISTTNDDEIVGITIGKQYKSIGRDKLLRYALINAAWNVSLNNDTFKRYYDSKIAQGNSHYSALGHTAHKLVRVLFKLLNDNIPFALV